MKYTIFLVLIFILNIYSKEKIRFYTQDFPPFSYKSGRFVRGPGADIIKSVCEKLDLEYKVFLYPWVRSINYAKNEKQHPAVLFFIGRNSEREKWLYFSEPVIKTEYGFFVDKKNVEKFNKIEDFEGYEIGAYGPSNTSKSLQKAIGNNGKIVFHMSPDDIQLFKRLAKGHIKGVYSNREAGYGIIKRFYFENIRYSGKDREVLYYFGFVKSNTSNELYEKFNDALENLKEDGTIKKILDFYELDEVR